jgi:hypothetical protein
VDKLQRAIQDDQPIGELLSNYTNFLADLAGFAKAAKRKLDRNAYLDYLRKVFEPHPELLRLLPPADATEEETRAALKSVQQYVADHPRRESKLRKLPADYFVKRWNILGRVPDIERMQFDCDQTRKLISRYEGFLRLIPADLGAAPRVCLARATPGGKRYDLFRFEDPPTNPAGAPPPVRKAQDRRP